MLMGQNGKDTTLRPLLSEISGLTPGFLCSMGIINRGRVKNGRVVAFGGRRGCCVDERNGGTVVGVGGSRIVWRSRVRWQERMASRHCSQAEGELHMFVTRYHR